MSPVEKCRKYARFPFKLVTHLLIVALGSAYGKCVAAIPATAAGPSSLDGVNAGAARELEAPHPQHDLFRTLHRRLVRVVWSATPSPRLPTAHWF